MTISGFNHASSPSDFTKFFYANGKPVIYHFDNGRTLVMSKQSDGYVGIADGKLYTLNSDGFTESEIGGGGGGTAFNIVKLPAPLTIQNINGGMFVSTINEVARSYPCVIESYEDIGQAGFFRAFPSVGISDQKTISFMYGAEEGLSVNMKFVVFSSSEMSGFGKIHSMDLS